MLQSIINISFGEVTPTARGKFVVESFINYIQKSIRLFALNTNCFVYSYKTILLNKLSSSLTVQLFDNNTVCSENHMSS